MDILRMIADLRSEREAIDEALVVLERLAKNRGKRRGRPPTWMSAMRGAMNHHEEATPRTRVLSAETRKRMAEAQKRRWAAYRKEQAAAES